MADTLTVYLSGDAWNGDPNATLEVNGIAVGGTLDVSSAYSADNAEAFTFTGNFGAAPTVSLSFINDASDGTNGHDRNLYLDGFAYDGVAQLNLKKDLGYDQTVKYTLASTNSNATRAADFQQSIGIDAHIDYWGSSYGLNGLGPNTALVVASTAYLGITRMRIGLPTSATLPELKTLMADGIKFDVLMPSTSSSALLPTQLAALAPIEGAVVAIEGPNEVNSTSDFSWNGQNTLAAAVNYQVALNAAVAANPDYKSASIYAFTLGGVGADAYASLGNISADATDGNVHVYFPNGTPPASTIQYNLSLAGIASPSDPTVITETNYTSAPRIAGSVSNDVQARYDLDLLLDAAKDGVKATYLYELLDDNADPDQTDNEDHYGLFNADGSPKEAATTIHNLMSVLSDNGSAASTFATGTLNYTVSGLPASGNTFLLQKSSGVFELAVWAEPEIWNVVTGTQVVPASRTVTVNFANLQSEVKVFDPLTGTTSISDAKNVSSVTVSVTDHPVIIEVEPPTSPLSLTSASVIIGAGPDTLAIQLSEDAFQGDAEFTVTVDGKQVGGTLTVTANHALGNTNTVDVLGTFTPGIHTFGIDFVNDLWMPTIGDRNLYVNSATIDGTMVANSAQSLMSNGTETTSFVANSFSSEPVIIGTGPDTLAIKLSEDAFQGNAQFTVVVDGKQVGGTLTATASHMLGNMNTVDVLGTFAPGAHTFGIDFVNDLWMPTIGDRNLYVNSASFDGTMVANSAQSLMSNGTTTMNFISNPTTTFGSGNQTLALSMSEDAYLGDAQFTVAIDGKQVGGTMTAVASHASGQTQLFDFLSNVTSGSHTLGIAFTNDLWSPGIGDRNLYVDTVSLNGIKIPASTIPIMSDGTQSILFSVHA